MDFRSVSNFLEGIATFLNGKTITRPNRSIHSIYVEQRQDWDCGIACCQMILNWVGLNPRIIVQDEIFFRFTPLWTIEIFMFLLKQQLNVQMYTVSIGTQPHHQDCDWYKETLDNDEIRINSLFEIARKNSLPIRTKHFEMSELQNIFLDAEYVVAIMLVNNVTLVEPDSTSGYKGHYILVLQFDASHDIFYYLDPGVPTGIQRIASQHLDLIRLHPATDEDLILCYRESFALSPVYTF